MSEPQAGRDLDALVAEKVMGLDMSTRETHEWGKAYYLDHYPYCNVRHCERCGADESIGCNDYAPPPTTCTPKPIMYSQYITAAHATPLAICLAALKAVGT